MTAPEVLTVREAQALERLREASTELSRWMGAEAVEPRAGRQPHPAPRDVELTDHLATVAAALVTLTTEVDVLRSGKSKTAAKETSLWDLRNLSSKPR